MTTKNFSQAGQTPNADELAEGLEVVTRVGLVSRRLAEAAESKPALARLLSLDLLGPSDASMLVRAGNLGDVLATVLDRLGGKIAQAADALLSVSREYRGQSYEERYNTAAYGWNPDYTEARNFYRQSQKVIRDVAAELARYQEEQSAANRAQASPEATPRTRHTRRIAAIGAVLLAVLGLSLYFVVRPSQHAATGTVSATSMEQRYDGKDPMGKDGPGTTCADPAHPSQPVTQVHPSVTGPNGQVVGYVELRTSSICKVIWARVYWRGGKFTLPPGWTLHVQMHRRIHPKVVEYVSYDTSDYVYGSMLATVSGCAYAEVFFAKGSTQTHPAITQCMTG